MMLEKSCGAIVYKKIDSNFEFLAIKSNSPDGHWGFPKGHAEEEETEEETCKREVFEETGLIITLHNGFKVCDKYQLSENTYKEVVLFIACAENQSVVLKEDEIAEYKWDSFKEIYNLLTYDSTKNMLVKASSFLDTI